jgi:hypothetical protein
MLRPSRALILLVVCLAAAPTARAASPATTVGVFRGAVNKSAVAEWEAWLGRPAYRVMDYFARESWDKIAAPSWWVDGWSRSAWRDRIVYSVPMLPDTPSSLAAGARGEYDAHFERLARMLIGRGQGAATIRLGWEFNGEWHRWNAAVDPHAFVIYWRRIVSAMRRQPGAAFRFDWCPNLGRGSIAPDRAYPGDEYVDYVGADVYDHGWAPGYRDPALRWRELVEQPYGLRWQRDFARAHGKRLSFPEWGVVERADGHGGGDNPYFIERMHDWIAANDVAYHVYFEVDMPGAPIRLMTGRFPEAAAAFRRLFGPQGAPKTGEEAPAGPPAGSDPRTEGGTDGKRKVDAKHNKARAKRGKRRATRNRAKMCKRAKAMRKQAKARRKRATASCKRAKAKRHGARPRRASGRVRR